MLHRQQNGLEYRGKASVMLMPQCHFQLKPSSEIIRLVIIVFGVNSYHKVFDES